jgi:uncharacterized protein (TIGR00251 family)
MIALANHREGVVLPVHVQPGAKQSRIIGEHGAALKVAVNAPAQDGKANRALLELLAVALGTKRSQLELLAGETGRRKRILVRGIECSELEARITALDSRETT